MSGLTSRRDTLPRRGEWTAGRAAEQMNVYCRLQNVMLTLQCQGRFCLRSVGTIALVAILGLLTPGPAAAQEPDPALRALEGAAGRYREVSAMCADFEQVIEVRLVRRTVESEGRVCQQRPNLFSMRFTDPEGDMVISDGEHFWVYYPSIDEEQVVRQPAAQSPGRHDFIREFLDDPAGKYTVADGGTEVVNGRECRVVSLTPKTGASYRGARLWLDAESHVIHRLELHEENGNLRTVTLGRVDLSPAPDPDLFVFEVPEGARVMGPRPPPLSGSRAVDGRRDREPRRLRPPSTAP